jgi:hypothetical protein
MVLTKVLSQLQKNRGKRTWTSILKEEDEDEDEFRATDNVLHKVASTSTSSSKSLVISILRPLGMVLFLMMLLLRMMILLSLKIMMMLRIPLVLMIFNHLSLMTKRGSSCIMDKHCS